MSILARVGAAILLLAAAVAGQTTRDFLTDDEIDQIKEAQEPNARLLCYLKFARLRLELIKQALAAEKAGRSKLIHNNLEDYTHIVEAMDSVVDDALARKTDVQKSVALMAEKEKEFLAALKELDAKPAKDRYLFDFAMKDALETTQDSLDESQNDLKARMERVTSDDTRDKKKRESMMSAADQEQKKAEAKQAQAEDDKAKNAPKAPTLRRKGEAPVP